MVPLLVVHDFNVADQIADDFYTIESVAVICAAAK
jgi:hypothetical protein